MAGEEMPDKDEERKKYGIDCLGCVKADAMFPAILPGVVARREG